MALFSDLLFGEEEFSMTMWVVAPSDSISLADSIAKSVSLTLQDSQNSVDSISDGVSLTAFNDSIVFGNANVATLFGVFLFGEPTWMKTEISGNLLLMPIKVLSDTMSLSDALQPFGISKALSDTLTLASSISLNASAALSDFIFVDDQFHIEVSNKALMDSINLNDWLQLKLTSSERWSD